MYKIEEDDDLSPLIGDVISTADVSEHSVSMKLKSGAEIQIEFGLRIDDVDFLFPIDDAAGLSETIQSSVLNKAISKVYGRNDTDLWIEFGGAAKLLLYGGNDQYECYSITGQDLELFV